MLFRLTIAALLSCSMIASTTAMAEGSEENGWEVSYWNLMQLYGNPGRMQATGDYSRNVMLPLQDPLFPVLTSLTAVSPNVYGFRGEAEVQRQRSYLDGIARYIPGAQRIGESEDSYQVQARARYSGDFGVGNVDVWLGASWQEQVTPTYAYTELLASGSQDAIGYNVGIDLKLAGFNLSGSYFDGELQDFNSLNLDFTGSPYDCYITTCPASETAGYIVSGEYSFGATRFGVTYGSSTRDAYLNGADPINASAVIWTIGLYHDLNEQFSFMTEISDFESGIPGAGKSRAISVGGSIRW